MLSNISQLERHGNAETKVPYRIDGKKASPTNPNDWTDFETACRAFDPEKYNGLGFVLTKEAGIVCIDLDGCIGEDGKICDEAMDIVKKMNSWTEISYSGKGLHIFVRGKKPTDKCRATPREFESLEVYDSDCFIALTGNHLPGTPSEIMERQSELNELCAKYFPESESTPAQSVKPELDLSDDESQDYRERTIRKALSHTREHYDPNHNAMPKHETAATDHSPNPLEKHLLQSLNGTSQTQKKKGLITRTASERLNSGKTKPPVTPLFDAFWLEGELAFLFGSTNVGKSILAVQIADAISRGAKIACFDGPKKPMRVCYFDFELTESQFFHRYSDENGNVRLFSDNFLTSEIDPNTTPPSDINFQDLILEEIERTIIERQIEVVVIDNLTALLSNIAETKNALELMHKLRLLKLRRNVSMLVIGHTPKRDLSRPLTKNDMAGSMHLMNFCDSAFAIGESLKESNVRYLKQIKTRNAEYKYGSENVVTFRIVKNGCYLCFEFIGFDDEKEHLRARTEAEMNELDKKIIALHQSDPNLSYAEIAKQLNTSKMRVSRVLKKALNKQNSGVSNTPTPF